MKEAPANYPRVKCGVKDCRKTATYIHTYYASLSMCDKHWAKYSAVKLGSIKTEKKAAAAQRNGRKGGRPKAK